ncbi:subunit of TFIID and SAGA complexes, putative [Candida dubliniensis CD36]|uniref:Transcription initiation factor TFIID subunit, putative n=1 Tax=Candida dubliniensis (strain CD36 / ATCC MYA-646 / CBS 7987 / NCPF 3949 / NRRL Y-17841) TaxID=573826 RepID=B9WER2_CANDC|nr:subunit of TFIID and SAGA complexes, putative [Candida dubliniensis CD36]CAX43174.1 subunit of TFIID and SAGA complexes, putative [Candida dubliniensis CD36]
MDSSAASSQEKKVGTSTPEAELNQHKVRALFAKLKEEMALAKTVTDPQEREKHYETVEKIKRILMKYQQQQQQGQGQTKSSSPVTKANSTNQDATATHTTNTPSPLATNSNSVSNMVEQKTETASSTPIEQQPIQVTTPQQPDNASTSPTTTSTTQPQSQQQTITIEKYNFVRNTLRDLLLQVKTLEASTANEPQTKKEENDRKIIELRNQMHKYRAALLHMKNVLTEQGKLSANSTPIDSPSAATSTVSTPAANATKTTNSLDVASTAEKSEQNNKPNVKPPSTTAASKSKSKPSSTTSNTPATKTSTSSKSSGTSKANNRSSGQNASGVSAAATKTASTSSEKDAPSTNTTSTSGVSSTATATTTTPTVAATSSSIASAITNKNTVDPKVTPSNIPDNDGRVLTKRKLVELINNISIDQGDVKIPIDNDVEDIFLDLADEFVRNVVQFSGRLAKHRKLDRIDIRDVQLNLEKNWGLRIPGYSTDEIRAARKWQADGEYVEKVKKISRLNKE